MPGFCVLLILSFLGVKCNANVVRVDDYMFFPDDGAKAYVGETKNGMILEKFYADTGANRSIFSDVRAAASFHPMKLNIGTAQGSKIMKSEGVGEMILYSPSGERMPGFALYFRSRQPSAISATLV